MLQIKVPDSEIYDSGRHEFIYFKGQELCLEHSLVSVSKWEAKWCKPYLSKKEKTNEEVLDYIACMTITQNVDPMVYQCLTAENLESINNYIKAPMTATVFYSKASEKSSREPITSELIYYWMIALNIPPEYQKWHLNRLLTLVEVCNRKNQPAKKMSNREILSRNASLNAERRKLLGTRG